MDKSQIIERARALGPAIAARIVETDQFRRLPAESAREFLDAGFARILVPKDFGGYELGFDTWYEMIREISKADGSHGWCAGLIAHHPHMLNQFPIEAQQNVWADGPDVAIAASVAPAVKVTPVSGGYRITGDKSAFSSGIDHAEWAILGGLIPGDGKPTLGFFLVPKADYTVKDTWRTTGMRGTGSNTVITDNVFVPESHVMPLEHLRHGSGSKRSDNYIFNAPFYYYAPITFTAPMVGAAMGAYAHFVETTRDRIGARGHRIAEQASVLQRLGRIAADIDVADMLLARAADIPSMAHMSQSDIIARNARDCTRAAEFAIQSIDTLVSMSGTAAFGEGNRLQRAWNDIHLAAAHMALNPDINYAHHSRRVFGLELDPLHPYFF